MEDIEKNFEIEIPELKFPSSWPTQKGKNHEEKQGDSFKSTTASKHETATTPHSEDSSSTYEVSHTHHLPTSLRIGIWSILILLIVRELVPGIGDHLNGLYQFLDCIVLPVFNWCYAILLKIIQFIISLPGIRHILGWLASLA